MSTVFVDTSVLVAAENVSDAALYQATLDWLDVLWSSRTGRTGNQALSEFYDQVTTAANPMPQGDARAAIRRYQSWTPWKTDAATLETAWAVQARHALDFGDCLAVACAQHSGCQQMLSLYLPHGAEFGGVTIVHPLRQAAPAHGQG
ncbi:PIN domain-containing protein [uncultured Comamonas sp.]|uniref:PIN domain-containing protein n=1 Tax=uncultured Comamonas sp. TaxID=114710 RepID=UPI003747C0A0